MDTRRGASMVVMAAFLLMNAATSRPKGDSSTTDPGTTTPTTTPTVMAPPPPTVSKLDTTGLPNGVVANETQIEYDISGTTAAALAADMNAKGPRLPNGSAVTHSTEWSLEWHFDRAPARGTCKLINPRVTVTDKVHLPRWIAPPGAAADLVNKFAAFRQAAATHEGAHRGIVIGIAASIALAIPQTTGGNCNAVEANANAAAKAQVDTIFASEKALDAKTRHGETEGAVFP